MLNEPPRLGKVLLYAGLLVYVGRGKTSNFAGFSRTNKNGRFCGNFAGIFEASFTEKWLVKNGRFCGSFPSKFRWKAIGFCADLRNVFTETRRSYSIYSDFIPQYEIVLYK